MGYPRARRTGVTVSFAGQEISSYVNEGLISFTYKDSIDEDADDLEIRILDLDGRWHKQWLNARRANSTRDTYLPAPAQYETSATNENTDGTNGLAVGDMIDFPGGGVYISSDAPAAAVTRGNSACKLTRIAKGAPHPYHLISEDGGGVYGWVDAAPLGLREPTAGAGGGRYAAAVKKGSRVRFAGGPVWANAAEGGVPTYREASACDVTEVSEDAAHPYRLVSTDGRGVYGWVSADRVDGGVTSAEEANLAMFERVSAAIVTEDAPNGIVKTLDCGYFEIDSVKLTGPRPATLTIKGAGVAYSSALRQTEKTGVWENITLEDLARKKAADAGFGFGYFVSFPVYLRRAEQKNESDAAFLQRLASGYGITVKIFSGVVTLAEQKILEQKESALTVRPDSPFLVDASFSTDLNDTYYRSCKVSYTDPDTGTKYEYTYRPESSKQAEPVLEVTGKKFDSMDEVKRFAEKSLRDKNKKEYSASFTFEGTPEATGGVTLTTEGFGGFDGKWLVYEATHSVSDSGYKTTVSACLALGELTLTDKNVTEKSASSSAGSSAGVSGNKNGMKLAWPTGRKHTVTDFPRYRSSGDRHSGTDIPGSDGDPIYAATSGAVVTVVMGKKNVSDRSTAGTMASYGNYVDIVSDADFNTVMRYAHMMSTSIVKYGDHVEAGQQIGRMGHSGNTTGPHLHYQVTVNGQNVNPKNYLP